MKQRVAALATAVAVTTASTPAIGLAASSTPHAAVSARPHGWGAGAGSSARPRVVELPAKADKSLPGAPGATAPAQTAPSTPVPAATRAAAPRALGSSPAVDANGQPCVPNDNQPTLADPQPTGAPAGAALPVCAPAVDPRHPPRTAKPHHAVQPAKPHRQTQSGTSHPASNAPEAGLAGSRPASGANGGSALTTPPTPPPTTAPTTTAPPTTPRDHANDHHPRRPRPRRRPPRRHHPADRGPADPPGGLSTIGPAPSTLAPPASTKVRTQPRPHRPPRPHRAKTASRTAM